MDFVDNGGNFFDGGVVGDELILKLITK